jgi:YVTN family beta-propeller protein
MAVFSHRGLPLFLLSTFSYLRKAGRLVVVCTLAAHGAAPMLAQSAATSIQVGRNPAAIAVNPATHHVYVANFGSNSVTVIDESSRNATAVQVGSGPRAIAVNSATNKVYVANGNGDTVTLIDGTTYDTETIRVGSRPTSIVVNELTNKVYVASADSEDLTVIDGASNRTASVKMTSDAGALALNSATSKIYTAGPTGGSMTVVEGATNHVAGVTVEFGSAAIAVDEAASKIYVANRYTNRVTVVDAVTDRIVRQITVGIAPLALAVNSANHNLYVANSGSNSLTVVDGAFGTTSTINVGSAPLAIGVDKLRNKVYVANGRSSDVTVISVRTGGVTIANVETGLNPVAIAVSPATGRAYVANYASNDVSVIEDNLGTQVAAVSSITAMDFAPALPARAATPFCPSSTTVCGFRKINMFVQGWVEYNTSTCAQIDVGTTTITKHASGDKIGKITIGTGQGKLNNGDCSTTTFTFSEAHYEWTADSSVKALTDPFTLDWKTKDKKFNVVNNWTAELAPRISGADKLWWWGKEGFTPSQTNYPTQTTLTATPSGYGPYTWSVATGQSDVKFVTTSTAETTQAESTAMSPGTDKGGKTGNIHITVTATVPKEGGGTLTSGPSNPRLLTALQPYQGIPQTIPPDTPGPSTGCDLVPKWYTSILPYKVLDQFGTALNKDLPVREHFLSQIAVQYPKSNWHRGSEGGGSGAGNNGIIKDTVTGQSKYQAPFCQAASVPVPECPGKDCTSQSLGTSTVKVHCWNGEVWVGSTNVEGIKLMTLTWERYQDHARHCQIESPPGSGNIRNACTCP